MEGRKFMRMAMAMIALLAAATWCASPPASLDTGKVRRLYMESDFEEAISILESAFKRGRVANHADSVLRERGS